MFLDLFRFGNVEKTAVTVSASTICFWLSTIPNQSLSAVSRQRFLNEFQVYYVIWIINSTYKKISRLGNYIILIYTTLLMCVFSHKFVIDTILNLRVPIMMTYLLKYEIYIICYTIFPQLLLKIILVKLYYYKIDILRVTQILPGKS